MASEQQLLALGLDIRLALGTLPPDSPDRRRTMRSRWYMTVSTECEPYPPECRRPCWRPAGSGQRFPRWFAGTAHQLEVGELPERRLTPDVERAAYAVVAESLARGSNVGTGDGGRRRVDRLGRRNGWRCRWSIAGSDRPCWAEGSASAARASKRSSRARSVVAEDQLLTREGPDQGHHQRRRRGSRRGRSTPNSVRRVLVAQGIHVVVLDIRLPPTHTDEGLRAPPTRSVRSIPRSPY